MNSDSTNHQTPATPLANISGARHHLHQAKQLLWLSILGAFFGAILAGVALPLPDRLDIPAAGHRIGVFVTSLFSLIYIGAATLFLLGLKDFKPRLRTAYGIICIGLVLLGLNFLQYPIFSFLNMWDQAWFVNGGANIPYIIALVLTYAGIRQFAQMLDVQSAWRSVGLVSLLALIFGLAGYALEHGAFNTASTTTDITVATEFSLMVLAIAAASLTLRIKQSIGPAYTNALAWFFIALLMQIIAVLVPTLFEITNTEKGPLLSISALITAGLYLRAGYVFNKISSY